MIARLNRFVPGCGCDTTCGGCSDAPPAELTVTLAGWDGDGVGIGACTSAQCTAHNQAYTVDYHHGDSTECWWLGSATVSGGCYSDFWVQVTIWVSAGTYYIRVRCYDGDPYQPGYTLVAIYQKSLAGQPTCASLSEAINNTSNTSGCKDVSTSTATVAA